MSARVFCGVELQDFEKYVLGLKDKRGTSSIFSELKRYLEKLEEDFSLKEALDSAMTQLEENKMRVYLAKDAGEAKSILDDLILNEDIIILDDSFELIETDFYRRVLETELNFTCTNPSMCLEYTERKKITVGGRLKYAIKMDDEGLSNIVSYLKDYSNLSTVGVGSPDFASSDLGNLFIIDDFWGKSLLCTAPRRNIFLIGIDRIINDFFLASNISVLKGKALDRDFNIQIHIINFPSRTGDIEKIVVYGAHGPREVTTIFIDNGRSGLLSNGVFSIGLSILNQFISVLYPELQYIANCLGIPDIDPLRISILLKNKDTRVNPDNVAIFSLLMEKLLPRIENLFWVDRLIKAHKNVYGAVESEISDVDAVENRVQELESIINSIWGGE